MPPTREIFWNIPTEIPLFFFTIITIFILFLGFYQHIRIWLKGKPCTCSYINTFFYRCRLLFSHIVKPKGFNRYKDSVWMHIFIFWGAVVLFCGTTLVAIHHYIIPFLYGNTYLIFSLTMDIFGILALIGVLAAVYIRCVKSPKRLDKDIKSLVLYPIFLSVIISGFVVEGLRIAALSPEWERWSVAGWQIARLFKGMQPDTILFLHKISWWFHAVISLSLIGYIPFSKLFHSVSSPINIFLKDLGSSGVLEDIDIENSEEFGLSKAEDFHRRQILSVDSCTECGRCSDQCPATISGKKLDPKKIIKDIREFIFGNRYNKSLIDGYITEDEIWACTTCNACGSECPVAIEVIDKIIGLRQRLVLNDNRFGGELKRFFKNLETNGNPWGIGYASRADWAKGLSVPILADRGGSEYLYWAGCAASYDNRNKNIATSLTSLLNAAGVDYAILGVEERCTGDSARRLGNEYLYRILAERNLETLHKYGVKKIITACPHCFNTIKNEYRGFGGDFEVYHHSEFILKLITDGDLKMNSDAKPIGADYQKITYHDPCYLGRHNGIFKAPREILKKLPYSLEEMPCHGSHSFCCGAGGGRMWLEEREGERINKIRAVQALALNPSMVVTSCPFCLSMMEDGLKYSEGHIKVKDISELLND